MRLIRMLGSTGYTVLPRLCLLTAIMKQNNEKTQMLCIQLAMEFDSTDSLAIMDYIEDFSVIKDPEKLVQFTNIK